MSIRNEARRLFSRFLFTSMRRESCSVVSSSDGQSCCSLSIDAGGDKMNLDLKSVAHVGQFIASKKNAIRPQNRLGLEKGFRRKHLVRQRVATTNFNTRGRQKSGGSGIRYTIPPWCIIFSNMSVAAPPHVDFRAKLAAIKQIREIASSADNLAMPELIVLGSQSVGKSSVMTACTGVHWHRALA